MIDGHDGLLTVAAGLGLAVSHADCVPVVIAASGPQGPALAAVHAGWRGMLAGIVGRAAAVLAGRGASLRRRRRPQHRTVLLHRRRRLGAASRRASRAPRATRRSTSGHAPPAQLEAAGVPPAAVTVSRGVHVVRRALLLAPARPRVDRASVGDSVAAGVVRRARRGRALRRDAVVMQFIPRVDVRAGAYAEVRERVAAAAATAGRDRGRRGRGPRRHEVRGSRASRRAARRRHRPDRREPGAGSGRQARPARGTPSTGTSSATCRAARRSSSCRSCSLIHSVSCMSVVQEIEARAAERDEVLLEINIAGEETKSGLLPQNVDAFLGEAAQYAKVALRRAHVHAAAERRPRGRAPVLRPHAGAGRTAFDIVAGKIYFRPAVDGHERRLRGRCARGRDHRAVGSVLF